MEQEKIKCEQCGKEFTNLGIKQHIWKVHTEEGKNKICWKKGLTKETSDKVKKSAEKLKNRNHISWNKGLTKETSESVKKSSETYSKRIKSGELKGPMLGKKHSQEAKDKLSKILKDRVSKSGLLQGTGRGKKGWYKGYWCDSSYELAYVIYNLEHGIEFERNKIGFDYIFNIERKYYPDFVLEDGTFVEIKGRDSFEHLDEKTKQKIIQFVKPLKVLYTSDMQIYLDYVKEKYGNNFIELYINKNHIKTNIRFEKIQERKQLILNSDIDFSKFGWLNKCAKLINVKSSHIKSFIKKNLPELLENSYDVKNPIKNKMIYKKPEKIETDFSKNYAILTEERKTLILNSGIDFSKFGWVGKVSELINIVPQHVNNFMKKHLYEFYESKCFIRRQK